MESDKLNSNTSESAIVPTYRPSQALDLFKKYASPDEKPLLKEWMKEGLSTAVHESMHLLSKDELGGYLLPDLTRQPRIDADKEFGRDNYLPTPKSIVSIPEIQGMTDTYLTGKEAASSARDFGFWLDELNAYNSETLLHKEKGRSEEVNVNFTGVTMFGAGYMQYLNKLNPQQRGKLFDEHGDALRKIWSTTEDALSYGASQGFPTDRSDYFNNFFADRSNRRAMEQLMGRPIRIPENLGQETARSKHSYKH